MDQELDEVSDKVSGKGRGKGGSARMRPLPKGPGHIPPTFCCYFDRGRRRFTTNKAMTPAKMIEMVAGSGTGLISKRIIP